jgi:hypothetical protein
VQVEAGVVQVEAGAVQVGRGAGQSELRELGGGSELSWGGAELRQGSARSGLELAGT